MKLKGKTVFVTGGAKRIGAEICRYFARHGANVAIHFNASKEQAFALKKEFGPCAETFECNLKDVKASVNCFERAISHFGKIDFLINNASVFLKNNISLISEDELDRDFNIHLKTPLFLMQRFAAQDFASEEGLIISLIDKNIIRENTKFVSYMLAKKSLNELTKFAAFEFAPRIRVNAISPGFIIPEENTSALSKAEFEEYMQKKLKSIPLKRMGSVEDIVQAVDFLISAKYINGANIPVDGGSFLL